MKLDITKLFNKASIEVDSKVLLKTMDKYVHVTT